MLKKFFLLACTFGIQLTAFAQNGANNMPPEYWDPNYHKIIPDKVIEIGGPLLFLFMLANLLVTILKNRAEHQLKIKMLDRGVSEETLIQMFKENNAIARFQPLKWCLFSFAFAIALIIIHLNRAYLLNQSGYLAVAIMLLCMSIAFFIYYRMLSNKS